MTGEAVSLAYKLAAADLSPLMPQAWNPSPSWPFCNEGRGARGDWHSQLSPRVRWRNEQQVSPV